MTPAQLLHTSTLLGQVLGFEQPADALVSAYFRSHKKLGRQDRHEIAETVFAALRHLQKIQSVLPEPVRQSRRAALAALVLGRGISISALADCTNAEETEFLGYLKAKKTEFAGQLNTAAELPEWLIAQLRAQGWNDEHILAFGRSTATPAPLDLRVNTLQAKRDKVLAQLQSEGIRCEATPYSPWGIRLYDKSALMCHPLFLEGTIEVQDEGSQLLARLTGARRGEIIVDFCAGAGGKTLALGAAMNNSGRLYAFDVAEKRLAKLKPRMVRAGLTNISPQRIGSETDPRLERLVGKADRVLVDAPCSGLGTLRRNPDLKYRQSPERIAELAKQQAAILEAAARLVRPGGRLVYATCSVLAAENERQAERFGAAHPDWQLVNAAELLPDCPELFSGSPYLQLSTAEHRTDGFFAAVWIRPE